MVILGSPLGSETNSVGIILELEMCSFRLPSRFLESEYAFLQDPQMIHMYVKSLRSTAVEEKHKINKNT